MARAAGERGPVGVRRWFALRPHRRWIGLVAAGVAAAVAVAVVLLRDGESGEQMEPIGGPPTSASPEVDPGQVVREPDGTERLPAPPLDVRGDAALVWTGSELVVWGGDVEAFNMGLPGPDRSYADGAVFDPATRSWRSVARSPLPATSDTAIGVATEDGVLFLRGQNAALWNPATDSWHSLPDAPALVTDVVSTGDAALSYSANARLDLRSGEWRALPDPPVRLERATTTWTGSEMVVLGGPGTPFTGAAGIAYDPERDDWRRLPSPPGLRAEALSAGWDGERVVVANYDMRAAVYDPATDSWGELPAVPARFYEWSPTVAAVADTAVAFMAEALVVLTDGDRWIPLPYGDVSPGAVATTRPAFGTTADRLLLFVWSLSDEGSNTLTAVDPERLVTGATRLQVGVVSVTLPDGYALAESNYDAPVVGAETVAVTLIGPQQQTCRVTSSYSARGSRVPDVVGATVESDDGTLVWRSNADSTVWETAATTSDTSVVDCVDPTVAENLVRSAAR